MSLLQLVSKTAFTPNDLKNVVSFLKTWRPKKYVQFYHPKEMVQANIIITTNSCQQGYNKLYISHPSQTAKEYFRNSYSE